MGVCEGAKGGSLVEVRERSILNVMVVVINDSESRICICSCLHCGTPREWERSCLGEWSDSGAPFDLLFDSAQAICLGVQPTEPSEHGPVQVEADLVCGQRIGGWMVRGGA